MWHSLQAVLLRLQPLPRSANPHRTGTANGASLDVASLDLLPRAPGPSLKTWVFSALYAFSGCSRRVLPSLPLLPYFHHNPVHKHLIHHRHMPQRPEKRRVIPHLPLRPFFIHRRKQRRQCHSHMCEPPLPQNLLHAPDRRPIQAPQFIPRTHRPRPVPIVSFLQDFLYRANQRLASKQHLRPRHPRHKAFQMRAARMVVRRKNRQ